MDSLFLERVVALWPTCLERLPPDADEDTITINLVNLLWLDAGARRWFNRVEFHFEPFGYTQDGTAYSLGEIDLAVILGQDRDVYLAYECKRLNVLRRDGRRSLATEYVREGLARFVRSQYSENLPVGCMLGYVGDGDVEYAAGKVRERIVALRGEIALTEGPESDVAIGLATRFYSRHHRELDGSEIEIRHALLPM
ncbi:MAG: hypothetical protein OXH70_14275 [Acidobacteria bacterium]|nr:hypothetical protein [Acidobacteriota bacterium]